MALDQTKPDDAAKPAGPNPAPSGTPTRRQRLNIVSIWRSIRLRPRLYLGAIAGLCVMLVLPASMSLVVRWTIAWNISALVYLVASFRIMYIAGVDQIRKRAARQDDGHFAILVLILLAIFASFGAIGGLINEAKAAKEWLKIAYMSLAALTIFVSWTLMQVSFTFHYAHEYYQPEESGQAAAGLDFPDDTHPDFWDFFYFSTSIGATSQTSDVCIKSKPMRRFATLHAIVSFFFNTTVLALTINLAASLL